MQYQYVQYVFGFMETMTNRWDGYRVRRWDTYAKNEGAKALDRWLAMFSPLGNGKGEA